MVAEVKALGGLETCATLGLLKGTDQADKLKHAGSIFCGANMILYIANKLLLEFKNNRIV
jgi:hypothetical protein